MRLSTQQTQALRQLAQRLAGDQAHLRLFGEPFTLERAGQLEHDPDLAERVDAFVGRLQDTQGDKLLPRLLAALGEIERRDWA